MNEYFFLFWRNANAMALYIEWKKSLFEDHMKGLIVQNGKGLGIKAREILLQEGQIDFRGNITNMLSELI